MSESASTACDVLDAVIEAMGGSTREGQQRMVAEIDDAICNRTRLMVQAGLTQIGRASCRERV